MRSSSNTHGDTATRATEDQNEWYKPYAINSSPTISSSRRTQESLSKSKVFCSHDYHDTQHGSTRDSTDDRTQQPQHTRRFDTCHIKNQILLVGEAVACRRPGAMLKKLESAWVEGVWLGRESKTDKYLLGTPPCSGMVPSRAVARRVERRRWDTTFLSAGPTETDTSLARKALEVLSDREPVLVGPIPKVHVNLSDDPDTAPTISAAAAPSQGDNVEGDNTICRRTNACEACAETEAEGAPPVQRTRTAVSVPGTAANKSTSETTTTSPARALVERVCNEAGEDAQLVQTH